jgi:CheY-like chemotaxis protein
MTGPFVAGVFRSGGQGEAKMKQARGFESSLNGAKGRILIVDDDAMVADVLSAQLLSAGYQVEVEMDPERAVKHLLEDGAGIAIVYCDLMMPGMTGMDVEAAVRRRCPKSADKLVFMTGGAFSPNAQRFISEHPDVSVGKPFNIVRDAASRMSSPPAPKD